MNLSDYQLKEIETDLMKTCWFYGCTKSGKIIRYEGTRCGNRAYAAQTEKRLSVIIDEFCKMDGTLFSITLTAPYKHSMKSIFESWKMVNTQWPVFLQWTRRNGFIAYIMSYAKYHTKCLKKSIKSTCKIIKIM
ncbi:MAG: hypothetical protein LBU85_09145 [Treponema sp.]|jgi:hypothetical protein|nr:hypothetical protein [Treponema sp.]